MTVLSKPPLDRNGYHCLGAQEIPFAFESVVPQPPSTFIGRLLSFLWSAVYRCFSFFFLIFSWTVLLPLHYFFVIVDRHNRRLLQRHHFQWPFKSVPHVREIRVPAPIHFPLENWHLRCEDGRQRWHYGELLDEEEGNMLGRAQAAGLEFLPESNVPLNGARYAIMSAARDLSPVRDRDVRWKKEAQRRFVEQYHLGLIPESGVRSRATPEDAMRDGVDFLLSLQHPYSGHWPNDYSGPLYLTPGLVFMRFITARGNQASMFPPHSDHNHQDGKPCVCGAAMRSELIRYLRNYKNADGGFGQHTEGHSTMLGTVLNYVALRLMGVAADDPDAQEIRAWILAHGGAVSIPTWGRVWLALLGLYDWEGITPLSPEFSLSPSWLFFAQRRTWCHSRAVSLPFSYLYGLRWSAPIYAVTEKLRQELYTQPYSTIEWKKHMTNICVKDYYTPHSAFYKLLSKALVIFERFHSKRIRKYAMEVAWKHIAYDDESTHFICSGPVNKTLNMLVTWIREGETSGRFRNHEYRIDDYLFMGPEGMRMNAYNGSQLWDTSIAIQAICASGVELLYPQEMSLAHHFIDRSQVQTNPLAANYFFRHRTKGAWNFSTALQSWQVTDCTAMGLRAILLLHHMRFPLSRIRDAVDEILSFRNPGGGWSSYEPSRAPCYIELINGCEVFKDVMADYPSVECSSSCIHTLALFREHYPTYRSVEVATAIREGVQYILSMQRADGSFSGSSALSFTYAAWLVSSALSASGELPDPARHPACVRLTNFLLARQSGDGGWGEDVTASARGVWVDSPSGSQVVHSAWAAMAVMEAAGDAEGASGRRRGEIIHAVERGIRCIMARQRASGDWAQERITGALNGNNPRHYGGYKNTMPVWALGMYNSWKKRYTALWYR